MFQRIRRAIGRAVQFLFLERGRASQRRRHLAQAFAHAVERLDRDRRKRRGRFLEIRFALLQNRRDVFDARENLATARFVVRRRHSQRFDQWRQRLLDVEKRIAFPARVDIEFPAHPRQRRADQAIIDLLRNRPSGRLDLFPARFELREFFPVTVDRSARPIARSARPLDPIHIIARERRILRAPRPKIAGQLFERLRCRVLRLCLSERAGERQEHDENQRNSSHLHPSSVVKWKNSEKQNRILLVDRALRRAMVTIRTRTA